MVAMALISSPPLNPKTHTKNPQHLAQKSPLQSETHNAHHFKSGFMSITFSNAPPTHLDCESGLLPNADNLFDDMPHRNLVSWTSQISSYARLGRHIDAVQTFIAMLDHGFLPNKFAIGSVLRSCCDYGDIRLGMQLHGLIVKMGLMQNKFLDSSLISMYARSKWFDMALGVLERMDDKDVYSWTSMIVGYTNGGRPVEALSFFAQMVQEGMMPNEYTFTSILKSSALIEGLREGTQIHGYLIKVGYEYDASVIVSLVDLYAKLGKTSYARVLYERSPSLDVVMCTAMIGGYAQNGSTELAIEVFLQMHGELGILSNEFTYANLIGTIAESGDLRLGSCFHGLAMRTGHASVVQVEGALINMYAKSGKMSDAYKVFESMEENDTISCSSLIAGFSCNGYDQEALEFYSNLHRSSVKPDPFILASAMTSCAKLADQLRGKQVHALIFKHGHESDTYVSSALVDMYAKSGSIEDAHNIFEKLAVKDRIAWTVMIDGYAQNGQGKKALGTFNKMMEDGIEPNGVTFVSILYACSHSGLIEEGISLFSLMHSKYRIKPVLHHYACVVDMLGRAGRVEEALEFISTMPMEPNALIWRSFLGACTNHKKIELGIYASKRLLELEPEDDATHVLLANMYAYVGDWTASSEVRNAMREKGLRKAPGLSWVEVGRDFHVFGSGDSLHPKKELIYKVLDRLMFDLKKAGYVPQAGLSLRDLGEEEKEKSLSHHSEKLAVSFGLISTPMSSPIRIFKNLRVCGDCHTAMKFISLIRHRKIIVRDVSRFHHFAEGTCSCGDYW